MHTVKDGIYDCLHHFNYLHYAAQSALAYLFIFHLLNHSWNLDLREFINTNLFFLLPKVFIDELFEVLVDLLNHDYAFEDSGGLFLHEAGDEVELALYCIEISAFKFEEDDPVGNYLIEGCLLPNFVVERLVIPEAVAEHLEKGQHFERVYLLVVHQLVKNGEEDGRVDYLWVDDDDLVEHLEDVVFCFDILLL
jgi:hypothetical protein